MNNSLASLIALMGLYSTLLLGIAFAANLVSRRRTAEFRHLVWVIAIALLLIAPPAALWGPKVSVPTAAALPQFPFGTTAAESGLAQDPSATPSGDPRGFDTVERGAGTSAGNPFPDFDAKLIIGAIYSLIASLLLVRLFRRVTAVGKQLKGMKPLSDKQTGNLVNRIAGEMGVTRDVCILTSSDAATPWTWGAHRPVIVIPRGFIDWTQEERRNALVHEMAHVHRFDFLTAILSQICVALLWFQPLMWLADRAMRREAEYACDDHVARFGASGSDYAKLLLRTARSISGISPESPLVSAMAGRREFAPRVTRILNSSIRRTAVNKFTRYSAIAAGIILALPLVALRSQPVSEADSIDIADVQSILINGPGTEAQLELAFDTLIGSGEDARAQEMFFDWFAGSDATGPGCHFCIELLDGHDSSPTSAHKRSILRSALDDVETLARSQDDPELWMRMVSAFSGSTQMRDLVGYYLLQARALGEFSDSQEFVAAVYLANSGQYQAGLDLINQLHEDAESDYYQSADTRGWINYLENKQALMDRIEAQISGDSAVVTATYEYMPAYKQAPAYPPAALDTKTEADVVVEYTITSTGRTRDARVVSSSSSLFDQSALESVANYRYMPRVLNGVPTDVPGVNVKILYRLEQ